MAFVDLDNTDQPKTDIPPSGVRISSRRVSRGDTKSRYVAIGIGALAAKAIGCHINPQRMSIRRGTGEDTGKIAISLDAKGTFEGKQQKSGCYLVTLKLKAIQPWFAAEFDTFKVDKVRIIPAQGNSQPMMIINASDEMKNVG